MVSPIPSSNKEPKPIEDFIVKLNQYGQEQNCCIRYYKFARLHRLSSPTTVKRRLQKYCNRVSEALSVVQGLNRSVFGSAIRIENPVMRKAWMLCGENQYVSHPWLSLLDQSGSAGRVAQAYDPKTRCPSRCYKRRCRQGSV